MQKYGLIGYPLGHSFSKNYFNQKFESEKIDATYLNFEIPNIKDLKTVLKENPELNGLNVTIPYKEQVIPYLDDLDEDARLIGAVNVIKFTKGLFGKRLKGYNSDIIGFKRSIEPLLKETHRKALILGTGGASKAVFQGLKQLGVGATLVSRKPKEFCITYEEITPKTMEQYTVIVNTTPLGMFPNINACPDIPYDLLTADHLLYDLLYNPDETLFMKKGKEKGAVSKCSCYKRSRPGISGRNKARPCRQLPISAINSTPGQYEIRSDEVVQAENRAFFRTGLEDGETSFFRIRERTDMQMAKEVDPFLPDHLKKRLFRTPMKQQVFRLVPLVDSRFFFGVHETTAYLQHPCGTVFDVDAGGRAILQQNSGITFRMGDTDMQRRVRKVRRAVRTIGDTDRTTRKFLQKHTAGKPLPAARLRTDRFQLREIFFPVPQKRKKRPGRFLDLPDPPRRAGIFHQKRHYSFHLKDWTNSTISCARYCVTGASESAFRAQS